MMKNYPLLAVKIEEISEGDEEFKSQLTTAIHQGFLDLKNSYQKSREIKDEVIIQQIRHKIKPTLILFGFDDIILLLQEGKDILSSQGFGPQFELHVDLLNSQLNIALEELGKLR